MTASKRKPRRIWIGSLQRFAKRTYVEMQKGTPEGDAVVDFLANSFSEHAAGRLTNLPHSVKLFYRSAEIKACLDRLDATCGYLKRPPPAWGDPIADLSYHSEMFYQEVGILYYRLQRLLGYVGNRYKKTRIAPRTGARGGSA